MIVVGTIGYRTAHHSLRRASIQSLQATATLKTAYIESYFRSCLRDLESQSELTSTVGFYEALLEAFDESGKSASDFADSISWAMITGERSDDLRVFRQTYGYYNIFLIDARGNVLYTVAGDTDIGANLYSGVHRDTRFSLSCKTAFETGRPVYSDLEFYKSTDDVASGFLIQVLVDEYGDKIGLLAFQITADSISDIMQDRTGLGETGENYLVGVAMCLRSDPDADGDAAVLKDAVRSQLTLSWAGEHATDNPTEVNDTVPDNDHAETMTDAAADTNVYVGRTGEPVIGFANHMDIAGVPMAIVAEMKVSEAFAPVYTLRMISLTTVLLTIFLVVTIAVAVTNRIVRPVRSLSVWAGRVATGDLEQMDIQTPDNEIRVLYTSFREVVRSFREIVDQANTIAAGDLT